MTEANNCSCYENNLRLKISQKLFRRNDTFQTFSNTLYVKIYSLESIQNPLIPFKHLKPPHNASRVWNYRTNCLSITQLSHVVANINDAHTLHNILNPSNVTKKC